MKNPRGTDRGEFFGGSLHPPSRFTISSVNE
jgi:hypothetical protein